jgi:hypothetical protein
MQTERSTMTSTSWLQLFVVDVLKDISPSNELKVQYVRNAHECDRRLLALCTGN